MTTSPAHFLNMLKFSTGLDALSLTPTAKFSNALRRARQLAETRSMLIPRIGQRTDNYPFDRLPLREPLRPAQQYTDDELRSILAPQIEKRLNNATFIPLKEPLRPERQLAETRSMLIPRIGQRTDNYPFDRLPLREPLRPAQQYTDDELRSILAPQIEKMLR